jgi:hypothetical protein
MILVDTSTLIDFFEGFKMEGSRKFQTVLHCSEGCRYFK